jgi:Trk K+ transport system NAD-binding subunit
MSTLGFGDITFHSDAGRLFSIAVLLSGIVLLLIMLPFVFIRYFYAPWLEAQLHSKAPRSADEGVRGHVILCRYDDVAAGLIPKLDERKLPYYVIEPDPATAAELHADGISVVTGESDNVDTYEALRAEDATLVVANLSDAANTNIALSVEERYPNVSIAAFAEEYSSVDLLELAGITTVIPLKHRLGEYLAGRVTVGPAHAHVVGRFKDIFIAEFPVEQTGLAGRTIRDTRLRELTGLNLVACWEQGRLHPARPGTELSQHTVAVVAGTREQLEALDAMFVIYNPNDNPVLVIGGGKVGQATAQALRRRGVAVNMIDHDESLRAELAGIADRVVIGDASNHSVIMKAGLENAPSVVLTTNDDAMNIFLAVYCRRLNPDVHIVSRITHERNFDAIHRAGADSVLSYTSLGVKSVLGLVLGVEATFVGEGADLIMEGVPASLAGKRLGEGHVARRTGLNVVAIQRADGEVESAAADTLLGPADELVILCTPAQRAAFRTEFG